MNTKGKQTQGLIFGIISLAAPTFGLIMNRVASNTAVNAASKLDDGGLKAAGALMLLGMLFYAAALAFGIVGIVTSAGASKAAAAAGEPKTIATIGLVLSIVGTVFGGITFLFCGLCSACVACAYCKGVEGLAGLANQLKSLQ